MGGHSNRKVVDCTQQENANVPLFSVTEDCLNGAIDSLHSLRAK